MSGDLEAGGALVTAGLVAGELESAKGAKSGGAHGATTCSNCNAKLSGRFCAQCGQPAHVHRSLMHIGEELLHGLFHFDTKSWRTLPLLIVRPGLLTRRYIDGQRVRYVSPLATFLFTVFLMFFVFSLTNKDSNLLNLSGDKSRGQIREQLAAAVLDTQKQIAEKEEDLKDAEKDKARAKAEKKLAELSVTKRIAEEALSAFDKANTEAAASIVDEKSNTDGAEKANDEKAATTAAPDSDGSNDPKPKKKSKSGINFNFDNNFKLKPSASDSPLEAKVRHNLENPELLIYKVKNTAYKYSFMLIPISLPFLWLMFFWRRKFNMYDHAIFSLYSLSFMSLYFSVVAFMYAKPALKDYIGVSMLIPPVHMFAQLKETYALGTFSTLWRTFALLFVASTVFALFIVMIIAISVT